MTLTKRAGRASRAGQRRVRLRASLPVVGRLSSTAMMSGSGRPDPAARRHFADDDVGPGWEVVSAAHSLERRLDVSLTGFRQTGPDGLDMRPRPLPAVTVELSLGADSLTVDTADERQEMRSAVVGIGHVPFRAAGRGVECVELRMSPFTAFTLLGGLQPNLNGTVVELADLWGPCATQLTERLASRRNWSERFAVVETALAGRLESGPVVDPEVRGAWSQLLVSGGSTRVDRLAADCGWSRKRLWGRFTAQIGVTPKRAAMLVRFDAAARCLEAGQDPSEVAVACGYADQAHLHRDVREFADCTPRELAVAAQRQAA